MFVDIIGVPYPTGGPLGPEYAPSALDSAGLTKELKELGAYVAVYPVERRSAADIVITSHSGGRFPLLIGGDHSVVVDPLIKASERFNDELGVIWIDAHLDANTTITSKSGNKHGMALYDIIYNSNLNRDLFAAYGVRSIDPGERENLRSNIPIYTSQYVKAFGAAETMKDAIKYLMIRGAKYIHLSIDMDVLDPLNYPGVSVPEANGLSAVDVCVAINTARHLMNVVSADIVEYNPWHDRDGVTAKAAISIAKNLVSERYVHP